MKKIFNYFIQGLLYTAPIGITLYIIYTLFKFVDSLLVSTLQDLFNIYMPGLGLIIIVITLILIGIVGQTIIARPFKRMFLSLLDKAPLLKIIFSILTDFFSAVVGKEKKFSKPVLVLVNPVTNLQKLGFLTEDDLSELGEEDKVAVYFPHSYNFSGEMFIVPKSQIKPVDINSAIIMKFIVSGGVSHIDPAKQKKIVDDFNI